MGKRTSAGFLIKHEGLYLIAHTTQDPDYVFSEDDPFWTIPRGVVEKGEYPIEGAIRETKEETGINVLDHYPIDHFNTRIHKYSTKNKHYVVYFLDDVDSKIINLPLKCESIIDNNSRKVRNGLPELDMFRWVSKEDAHRLVTDNLKHMFE